MPIVNPTVVGNDDPVNTTFPVTRGNANATESVLVCSGIITEQDLIDSPLFTRERNVYILNDYVWNASDGGDTDPLPRHLYFDNTADVRQLRNITIDLNGHQMFIHRDRDNTEFMVFSNVFFVDTINIQSDLIDEGGRWNARGGGYIRRVRTGTASKWIQAGNPFSDVLVKSEEYCERGIESLYLNDAGEYQNITAIGVEFLQLGSQRGSESDATRVLMHDSEFSSITSNWQARIIADGNTNFMLNDCAFTNYRDETINNTGNGWMRTTSQGSVTDKAAYNYFMGSTASIVRNSWQNAAHNLQRRLFKGSLKYFQIFKDGQPLSEIHYRVYSKARNPLNNELGALTERKSAPTTTLDEMLHSVAASPNAVNGEIDIAIIKTMISYITGQWRSTEYEDIVLRLRAADCVFQDYVINADQALISQGRPDNHVPLVVLPDPHYFDEGIPDVETQTNVALNFTTRTVTIDHNRAITPRELYYYLKHLLIRNENYNQDQFFSYDSTTLDLGNWNLVWGNNCTAELLGSSGTIIRTTGQITFGSNFTNEGVTLIDQDGVSVQITSNVAGTRCNITYGSTDIIRTLPFNELLPINTQINVTAKADGYLYQKYTFNTGDHQSLDIRLPKDPSIDLNVTFTAEESNKFGISRNGQDGRIKISVGQINLSGQKAKQDRIIDDLLSKNIGLRFLTNYVDELSGSPLGGVPIVYERYRTTMDVDNNHTDGKITWEKTAGDTERCRVGSPIFTPGGTVYFAPLIAGKGSVVFDNEVLSNVDPDQIAEAVAAEISEGSLVTDVTTALAPRFNTLDTSVAAAKTAIDTKPSPADIWNHEIIEPMDDGEGGMTPAISAETYLDTSIPQTIQTSQAAIIAAVNAAGGGGGTSTLTAQQVWDYVIDTPNSRSARDQMNLVQASTARLYLDFITNGKLALLDRLDANISSIPSSVWTFNLRTSPSNINARSMLDTLHQQYADIIAPYIVRMHTELTADQRQEDVEGSIVNHETVIKKLKDNEASLATVLARLTGDRAGYLDNLTRLDVDISSRLATTGYTAPTVPPTAAAIRDSVWTKVLQGELTATSLINSIKADNDILLSRLTHNRAGYLDRLDVNVSSRLATTGYTAPPAAITGFATAAKLAEAKTAIDAIPTAVENRTEMEKAGTKLTELQSRVDTNLNATISSRLAGDDYTTPPTVAETRAELEKPNTKITLMKAVLDKFRFAGTADAAGTQKVSADSTITGTVESGGLTDAQDAVLTALYKAIVNDSDATMQNIKEMIEAIMAKTDKLGFSSANDVKATLDGEQVVTNAASRTASKSTGFATPANITALQTAITTAIANKAVTPATDLSGTNAKIDAVKEVVDDIPTTAPDNASITAIKTKVDANLNDTITSRASGNRVEHAITLIGGLVIPTTAQIKTALEATGSILALGKAILDKFHFTGDDVRATLDGERVTTDNSSRVASRSFGFATPANVTAALNTIITAITNKPVTPVTDLTATNNKIDAVKGVVDGNSTKLTANKTAIDGVKTVADGNSTKLTANKTAIDGVKTVVDANGVKLTANKTVLDALSTTLGTVLTQTTSSAISSAVEAAFLNDADGRRFLAQIFSTIEDALEDENLTITAIATAVTQNTLEAALLTYAPPTDGSTDEHAGTVGRALFDAGVKLIQNKAAIDANKVVLDSNATKLDNMPDSVWSHEPDAGDDNSDDKETNLHAIRAIAEFMQKFETSDYIHDDAGKIKRVDHNTGEVLRKYKSRPPLKHDWSGGREIDDEPEDDAS